MKSFIYNFYFNLQMDEFIAKLLNAYMLVYTYLYFIFTIYVLSKTALLRLISKTCCEYSARDAKQSAVNLAAAGAGRSLSNWNFTSPDHPSNHRQSAENYGKSIFQIQIHLHLLCSYSAKIHAKLRCTVIN